jgi:hypothetical protein
MKEISLTQGLFTQVDDENYDFLNQWRWHARVHKYTSYAARSITKNGKETVIHMHRLIMDTPNNLEVDHINFNGLDNRKSNLRNVTHSENILNCRFKKTKRERKLKKIGNAIKKGISRGISVCEINGEKRYRCYIKTNGNIIPVYFNTEKMAVKYNKRKFKIA